jgi:hypothetical protein
MTRTSTAARPLRAAVRLDWLAPDPELGERLALVFLAEDSQATQDTQRARQALDAALGRDGAYGKWDGLRGMYFITLDGLVQLQALARRHRVLEIALAELETRDPEFEHWQRDLRRRKLLFARWEQEEKTRQARARQTRREEREQRGRERAQRQDVAQRAWPMPGLPPEVAAAFSELALLPSAPPGLVDLAFRYFARQSHPDTGDQRDEAERLQRTERMKHLNRSREILTEYFARQAVRKHGA